MLIFRRGKSVDWAVAHQSDILEEGQPAVEITPQNNQRLKIGDGTTAYKDLNYIDLDKQIYSDIGIDGDTVRVTDTSGTAGQGGTKLAFKIENIAEPENDNDAATKGYVDNSTYNPNLLFNPNFKINQRGSTKFEHNGVYSVDRWIFYSGDSMTVTTDGLVPDYGACTIMQKLENMSSLYGKVLTLSCQLVNNVVSISGTLSTKPVSGNGLSFRYDSSAKLVEVVVAFSSQLLWIKLEVGSNATSFVPPHYQDELYKRQYYYRELGASTLTGVYLKDINMVAIAGNFQPMREVENVLDNLPTLTVDIFGKGNTSMTVTNPVIKLSEGSIALKGTITNNYNVETGYFVSITSSSAPVVLDCEIY